MLGAGLFLLARRNRDKSLMLQNVDRYIQQNLWGRFNRAKQRSEERQRARREQMQRRMSQRRGGPQLVLRLPQIGLRFPNMVDRYLLKAFFRVFGIAVLSGLAVYLAADITENVEDILQNEVSSQIVFAYYQYKSFSIIYEIMPLIVLITTLTTFGLLSRTNELTALKASGVSVFRLAMLTTAATT